MIRAGGAVALAALLVAVGRWEADRHVRREVRAMERTLAAARPLDSPTLSAYRDSPFECLLYRRDANELALEVCFDEEGRLVETVDRRGDKRLIASLRERPEASTVTVDPDLVESLVERLRRREGSA